MVELERSGDFIKVQFLDVQFLFLMINERIKYGVQVGIEMV